MTHDRDEQTRRLRAELRQLRAELRELAAIVHTHVRTDLPPDACLPAMRRFRKKLGRAR